jgi:hypothetical protein
MKQNRSLINWLTVCGVALLAVATVTAQAAEERVAKVVRVKGAARHSTDGNVWQPVKLGDTLKAGQIVQTAAGAVVDIVFTEAVPPVRKPGLGEYLTFNPTVQRDIVRVQPDSVLAIDKLTETDAGADKVTETQLDLRSGRIIGSVNKVSAASTFEVKIPNGVAGIRGTIFSISALGVISVLQGAIGAAYNSPDGPKVEVIQTGFEFDIRTGELRPLPMELKSELAGTPRDPGQPIVVFKDSTKDYTSSTTGHKFN